MLEQQREHESQWAAIVSVAGEIGRSGDTLGKWVRQTECDLGRRDGLASSERERLE